MAAAAALRSAARNLRAPPATFTAAAREGQRRLLSSSSRTAIIQARSPLRQFGRLRAEKFALEKKNAELLRQVKQCGDQRSEARFQTLALMWLVISTNLWLPVIAFSRK